METYSYLLWSVREGVKNILRFKKPSKWVIILAAVLCMVSVVACAVNPKLTIPATDGHQLYGNYAFEQQIYMNPLSSFLAFDDYQEYYMLTDNSLIVRYINGSQQEYSIAQKKTIVDKQTFKEKFFMENVFVPDISSYQECYQLTEDTDSSGYRIYQMDDELWLVRMHTGDAANIQKRDYIWSIYKIAKFDGEFPVKTFVYGTTEGVEDFLSLQGEFQSGYDIDTCYNITPEEIKQDSDYQIFKYDVSCASFLLYEDEIYPLGEWFGGLGVTSMALADVDGDGKPELYFTYSWGSGLHHSHVAYFSPVSKQIIPLGYSSLGGDMLITMNNRNGGLSLYAANISNLKSFTSFDMEKADYISDIVYENNEISLL